MSATVNTAIILAGGLGTRLRSVVSDVPKPMALVNNKPFLWHLFRYWSSQSIQHFIVSIGYKGEVIRNYFGDNFGSARIDYVSEESPLGTGGALLATLKSHPQTSPFVLLNGDTYFEIDLGSLNQRAIDCAADWCISLFSTTEKSRYLLFKINQDGLLLRGSSTSTDNPDCQTFANGGVYWINPKLLCTSGLGAMPISLENTLLNAQVDAGRRIVGFCSDTPFIDIGLPSDYQSAQSLPFFSVN